MNNFLKGLAIAGLVTTSSIASADWSISGGYANFNEDDDGLDVSLGAIYASAGYHYESGNVMFMPEIRLGVGVSDDDIFGVNVEIDSFFAASIRGQYNVTESFGVFLQPSYARLELTASGNGVSFTDDDWEFGFGGGATFKLSDAASIEAFYETYDGTDVISIGARFAF